MVNKKDYVNLYYILKCIGYKDVQKLIQVLNKDSSQSVRAVGNIAKDCRIEDTRQKLNLIKILVSENKRLRKTIANKLSKFEF